MDSWTTDGMPVANQFSYWRDAICDAFTPLTPRRRHDAAKAQLVGAGMKGWVRAAPLASTHLAEIASDPQLNIHGPSEVARTDADVTFVNLVLEGVCVGEQAGRTCVVEPGGFALFDSTRPFALDYVGQWRVLSMRVPNSEL